MGYNISEVTGATGGGIAGLDIWTFDIDLDGTGVTTVSGDFDEVPLGGGASSEASLGYTFGALSTTSFGTLSFTDTTTGAFTFTIDRSAFFASGTDQTVTFTVTGDDGGASDTDTVVLNLLICVARGTRVATVAGPIPVEALCVGDLVETVDGAAKPVRWIGSRRVTAAELAVDPTLRPVTIAAGAFGDGRPQRSLSVSQQHRILLRDRVAELLFGETEVLVPAKALLNDMSIRVDHGAEEVEYFHVLFDAHEIMVTEGLPTESFHPGDYALGAMDAAVRRELLTLFPEFDQPKAAPSTARMSLRPWEGRLLSQRVTIGAPRPVRLAP